MERNRTFFTLILAIMAVSAHAAQNTESHDAQIPELIQAAQIGDLSTVNRLINAGTNLEVRNNNGETALSLAARAGHTAVIQALVTAGANIETASHKGTTPLMLASEAGHLPAVQALLTMKAHVNAATPNGYTALILASEDGHTGIVRRLLQTGADPNAATSDGSTALITASLNGHTDTVQLLLRAGADPNAATSEGWTALIATSQNGHTDIVQILLEYGAGPNAATSDGTTALMLASHDGHTDIARLLLRAGAAPNAAGGINGFTALTVASHEGSFDVVRTLIAAGANLNATTHHDETASDIASRKGHKKIVALLAAAQQSAQSLQKAIQEYCYRKSILDEIELQYKTALEHRDQLANIGQRARALRENLTRFAEQSRQGLPQAETALKNCKKCTLKFIRRGTALSEAAVSPLLEDNNFENFHVTLIEARNKRLLEQYRIFETLFGHDASGNICKLALPRSDYRQIRALLAQRAQIARVNLMPFCSHGQKRKLREGYPKPNLSCKKTRFAKQVNPPVLRLEQRPVDHVMLDIFEPAPPAANAPNTAPRGEVCTIL